MTGFLGVLRSQQENYAVILQKNTPLCIVLINSQTFGKTLEKSISEDVLSLSF
jgi:hypothetical protein